MDERAVYRRERRAEWCRVKFGHPVTAGIGVPRAAIGAPCLSANPVFGHLHAHRVGLQAHRVEFRLENFNNLPEKFLFLCEELRNVHFEFVNLIMGPFKGSFLL